jgi:hypothetical protein
LFTAPWGSTGAAYARAAKKEKKVREIVSLCSGDVTHCRTKKREQRRGQSKR